VDDHKEIAFKRKDNPLAHPRQADDPPSLQRKRWRINRAENERTPDGEPE
jgi:hypothetical protein